MVLIAIFIWIRGTLPRVRMDQLMNLAWKFMLPLTLVNLIAAGCWHYLSQPLARWGVTSALIVAAYWSMGRGLMPAKEIGRRVYRYAD
jgi:NADH-quinone oxidoreductase subunit H